MSEQLRHHDSGEKLDLHVEAGEKLKQAQEQAKQAHETSSNELEQIRNRVEQSAISGRETPVGERQTTPSHTFGTHKQLKHLSYKRTLSHIQSRLKGPEKLFSKTVHGKVVERVSAVGAATIARPRGLVGGGFLALMGSIFSLYLAKRYGFTYNFTIFILLFAIGYFGVTLVELVLRLFKRPSA